MVPSQPLRTASDAGAPVDPDASAQNLVPSWLPKAKVLAPALPAGYVRHASLLHHIEGTLVPPTSLWQKSRSGLAPARSSFVH